MTSPELNAAQTIIISYYGQHDGPAPQVRAPHAPRETQPKLHRARKHWDKLKFSARLGSRPPVFGGRV